jgi:hypothetical protein
MTPQQPASTHMLGRGCYRQTDGGDMTTTPDPARADDSADETPERLRYRLLTGPDDRSFCERVSAALDDGYVLHGGPTLTFDGDRVIAGQAVVLPGHPTPETRLV